MYAVGKIPGGFIRREGRPSQDATLASRLTDRTIRPLLPKSWRRDIQVVVTVLSTDQENDPNLLGIIGASAALSISEIPFEGPASGVTVGYLEGKLVLNPQLSLMAESTLDLVVCSTHKNVVMVEAGAKEVSEDLLTEALKFGHEANQAIIDLQEEFVKDIKKPKLEVPPSWDKPEIMAAINEIAGQSMAGCIGMPDRNSREAVEKTIKADLLVKLKDKYTPEDIKMAYDVRMKALMRASILEKSFRMDGRGLLDIRAISCEVSLLPRTHGSALFNRGETQVMTTVTLGSMAERQQIDGLGLEETKHYIHHYNFPPFSTGETGRIGTTGRREIGHGALAERALQPVVPSSEEFPYTIRLVSEALGSNGSTSMASTCGSTLALMDAGVPIKKPVSGIAMGLITDEQGNFAVLNDIAGVEDFYGDMDFKVAGTKDGITALQMDVKVTGIKAEVLTQAVEQAKRARMKILDLMVESISVPREKLSQYAPKIVSTKVPVAKIGDVIGSGGKIIHQIQDDFLVEVNIEDDGTVTVTGTDQSKVDAARAFIDSIVAEAEVGMTYQGTVARVEAFGAFVNILPGKDGLVHISQVQPEVFKTMKIGDKVEVRCYEVDSMGRVNLTMLKEGEEPIRAQRPMGGGGDRPRFGGGDRGGQRGGGRPNFRNFRDSR